jgi:hypothetical protein
MTTATRTGWIVRVVGRFFSDMSDDGPVFDLNKSNAIVFDDRENAEKIIEREEIALARIEPNTGWIVRIDEPAFHYGKGFDGFYSTYVHGVAFDGYSVSCDRDNAFCFATEIEATTFVLRHRLVRAFVEWFDGEDDHEA